MLCFIAMGVWAFLPAIRAGAATLTFTLGGGSTDWSQAGAWTPSGPAAGAGNIATLSGTAGPTTTALNGSGQVTIGQITDTGTGSWTINAGTATGFTLDNTGGVANPLGDFNSFIGVTGTGILTINPSVTIANTSLDIGALNGGSVVVSGGIAGTGNLLIQDRGAGTITLSTNSLDNTGAITNAGDGAGSVTISAAIGSSVTGVTQDSAASSLILTGVNLYTGATTIDAGTLNLGGGGATGSISSSSPLVLGGGKLSYTVNNSGSQSFNGLTVSGSSASAISVSSGNTVSVGNITRTTGGTIDFNGAGIVDTNDTTNSNGILGGWATVGGTTWAVAPASSGGAITGLSTYTTTSSAGTTAGNYTNDNIDVTNSAGTLSGAITPNSLRFNTAGAETMTLNGASTIGSGGILVTSNVGNNASTISGNTLEGSSGRELIIIQNNTGNSLTINSVIANNAAGSTGLTKSGLGNVTLTGTETFTGNTVVNSGTLTLSNTYGNGPGAILSPFIDVNPGAAFVLASGGGELGYTSGVGQLVIDDGLVYVSVSTSRATLQNQVIMVGGTLAGAGAGSDVSGGNANTTGAYSWDTGSALLATSDSNGNPAVISAQTSTQATDTFSVNRGANVSGDSPDLIVSGAIDGTHGLTITGTGANGGITVFSAPNTFSANTSIQKGIVDYENGIALGGSSNITVSSGATAQVQGGISSSGTATLNISGAGDTGLGATGALENVSGNNSYNGLLTLGASATISSDAGTLKLTNAGTINGSGDTLTLAGNGSGSIASIIGIGGGGLTVNGPGAWTLTGANTFSGATTVQGGTLLVGGNGSINNSSGITVSGSGAKFVQVGTVAVSPNITLTQGTVDGTSTISSFVTVADSAGNTVQNGNGGTGTLTIGNLTFNGAATVNLFDSNTPATAPLNVTGVLITGGTNVDGIVTVNAFDASGWANGSTYDLLNYSSLVADGVAADDNLDVIVGNLTPRQDAMVSITGTAITVTISGDAPKWTGADNGNWQVGSTGPNGNWKLITSGSATNFIQGDDVLFDDTALTGTVNISDANVSPTSTTFNNNALNYTLISGSGFGIAGAGSLVKDGTGTLTIETPNTYTGVTTVNAGIVNYQNGAAFGVSSAITITSGATAQVQGSITGGTNTLSISGTGAMNATGALESVSGNNSYAGPVSLGGNSTISSDSGDLTLSGAIGDGGNGYSLTTTGTGAITLSGANTFSGATNINEGIVSYQNGTAFGTNSPITISSGATAQVQGGITGGSQALAISGSGAPNATGVLENVSGSNSFAGPISLNANSTISADAGALTLSGGASGNGNLTLVDNSSSANGITLSSGSPNLAGAITNTGTTVGSSTLISAAIGSNVTNLIQSSLGTLTLTNTNNAFTGNVVVNSGTLAAGGAGAAGHTGGTTLLGSTASPGRTVTVNSGATLSFLINNVFGNAEADAANIPAITITDGTLTTDNYNVLGNLTLNGATVTGSYAANGTYQEYQLMNTVTVGGSSASIISNAVANTGVNLTGTVGTTFNVGQTGATGGDLIVAVHLQNASGDFAGAAAGLTKTGLGTLVFQGTNNYTGATTLDAGIINYQNGQALGGSSAISIASGSSATIQVQGGITGGSQLMTIGGAGAANATGALENVNGSNSYAGAITLTGNSTISSDAGTLTLNAGIGDGGNNYSLTTTGTGKIVLAGANTYGGTTTVNNGVLVVIGSLDQSANVTLDDTSIPGNPVLAGNGNGTSTGVMGSVTLPANNGSNIATLTAGTTGTNNSIGELTMENLTMNGGQLLVDLNNSSSAGSTYDFINVLGTLTLPTVSSDWTLTPNAGADAGVYTILTGASSNIGSGAALPTVNNPTGDPLVRSASYTPSFSGNSLLITVGGGAASIIWTGTGANGNYWDIATTKNWNDSAAVTPTGQFFDGDSVTFGDGPSNTNITVQSGTVSGDAYNSVTVGSMTVNSNTDNYTIGGQPIIDAGGLTKSGSSTLTLTGSNSFTGATSINGGILNVGNAGALAGGGNITFGGGTLQYSASNQADFSPQIVNSSGPIAIDVNGQSVSYGSALGSSNTGGLSLTGNGSLTLNGINTYTGNTTINSGTLTLTAANGANGALASPAITVNAGAELQLTNNDTLGYTPGRNVVTLNDGTLYNGIAADRDTIDNTVTMDGGTIAAAGAGNNNGAYSWDTPNVNGNFLNATSDASGNPATISAQTALETSGTFNVTRGTDVSGFEPDLVVSAPIAEFSGNDSITFAGNGITALTAQSTYNGPTYINSGATVLLGDGGTTGRLATGTDSFIVDDGTLVFDRINSGVTEGTSFPKGISGTGAVELIGSEQNVTFNSVETYTGPTTIAAGSLNVTGSLNGSSSTTVTNATLFGAGYIANPVIIGNGTDAAGTALLQPGSTTTPGTLTTGSTVSLLSDADFVFTLNSTGGGLGAGSSELIAQAVSLNSSAEFTFSDLAVTPGSLTQGDTLSVISTTSGLTGTFSNLANGQVFASQGNIYQASYGADGLTLTVVPEPATWGMIISGFGLLLSIQKLRKRKMGI